MAETKIDLEKQAQGVLPVSNGGTGVSTTMTEGSVLFSGAAGAYSQDNAKLFWDDSAYRLGIGTATPAYSLDVVGEANVTGKINTATIGSPGVDLLADDSFIRTYRSGNYASSVFFDGSYVWTADGDGIQPFGTLTKISPSDGSRLATYTLTINQPKAMSSDGTHLWISSFGQGAIAKVRMSDGVTIATIGTVWQTGGSVFDGTNIWVTRYSNAQILKIDAVTEAISGPYATGAGPFGVEFDGTNIWVANGVDGTLTKLLASDGSLVGTYPVGAGAQCLEIDGAHIWVTLSAGSVVKVLLTDGSVVGTYPTAAALPGEIRSDGTYLYVSEGNNSQLISKILLSDGSLVSSTPVGSQVGLGLYLQGSTVWAAASLGGGSVVKMPLDSVAAPQYKMGGTKLQLDDISGTFDLVHGSGLKTHGRLAYWTDNATIGEDSLLFWNDSSKRLGVGTTAPTEKLQVAGNIAPEASGTRDLGTSSLRWANLYMASNVDYASDLTFSSSGEKIRMTTAGNLGIGTASPSSKLHVNGSATVDGTVTLPGGTVLSDTGLLLPSGGYNSVNRVHAINSGASTPGSDLAISSGDGNGGSGTGARIWLDGVSAAGTGGSVHINSSKTGGFILLATGDADGGLVAGNVGIRNSSPANALSVTGTADVSTSVLSPIFAALAGNGNGVSVYGNAGTAGGGGGLGGGVTLTAGAGGTPNNANGASLSLSGGLAAIGGNLTLSGGVGVSGATSGGSATVTGGGLYSGSGLYLTALNLLGGDSTTPSNPFGGYVNIRAGNGNNSAIGASVVLKGGNVASTGSGGDLDVVAGNGPSGPGGSVSIACGTGASSDGTIKFKIGAVEKARVHTNGFFGILNAAPANALSVTGTGEFSTSVRTSIIVPFSTSFADGISIVTNNGGGGNSGGVLTLATGGFGQGGGAMNISTGGGLGGGAINISAGAGQGDGGGAIVLTSGAASAGGSAGGISLTTGSASLTPGNGGNIALNTGTGVSSGIIKFSIASSEKARIHTNGFVGIGTAAPVNALDVAGSAGVSTSVLSPIFAATTGAGNSVALNANNLSGVGTAGSVTVNAGIAPDVGGNGGAITLNAGGAPNGVNGGTIALNAGTGNTLCGSVNLTAGADGSTGGSITLLAGRGFPNGGTVTITGGAGHNTGVPGPVNITSGAATGAGNANGALLSLGSGVGSGTGVAGAVAIKIGGVEKARVHTNGFLGVGTATPNSTLSTNGSISITLVSKTATYTAAAESVIICDATAGAFTVNLPAASGLSGRIYTIKKIDSSANAVTIDGDASETIDGATTLPLTLQYQAYQVICDGTQWWVI